MLDILAIEDIALAMTTFSKFNLIEPLTTALTEAGYKTPTPIQEQSIPPLLLGNDLLGIAQTGTGKTAAFALPILQKLTDKPHSKIPYTCQCLILTPTRELASQIQSSFSTYGKKLKLRSAVIFGGVNENPQIQAMGRSPNIVIATPGRLLDLMNRRKIILNRVEIFVLDEADRMLDMGFINDVKKIVSKLPQKRQTLLFSATMPHDISKLAESILKDPIRIEVTPPATTVEKIDQCVFFVDKKNKIKLLRHILETKDFSKALIFTRTKRGANKVSEDLNASKIRSTAIHGNKSQVARVKALEDFKTGRTRVLIATDIAARGIDVPEISHVFNYDLPEEPESYVHRIGRTARAGRDGSAIAFCDASEIYLLRGIERTIRVKIPVIKDHPFPAMVTEGDISSKPRTKPMRTYRRPKNKQKASFRGRKSR